MTERLLVLVRHGESDFASPQMTSAPHGDQWDPPLSAKGLGQAKMLTARLLLLDPAPVAVYASPMTRARETAATYADATGADVAFDPDLREAHIGEWEAKSFQDIVASDDELLDHLRNQKPIWGRAPGGEKDPAFRRRVVDAIEKILARHPEGDVLVVCHGGVINAYCADVLGLPQEMFFLPENTSVNSIEVDGDRRRVRFLNDVVHLTDPQYFQP